MTIDDVTPVSLFSHRTQWVLADNALTRQKQALKESGDTLNDLTLSNPTQVDLHYQEPDRWLQAFAKKDNLSYQALAFGSPAVRKQIAAAYQAAGYDIQAKQIVLTSSTSEAYHHLFRLLTNPGDRVLFPTPSYPLFRFLTDLNDIQMQHYPWLKVDTGWQLDTEFFQQKLRDQVRSLVVVHPNNPTGSFYSPEDMSLLETYCVEQNCALIADEVFIDYVYVKPKPLSFCALKNSLTFVLGGLSKAMGLPQMKLAWIVVCGPDEQVTQALQRLEMITDTFLSVNAPVQNAYIDWQTLQIDRQTTIKERIKSNMQATRSILADSLITPLDPQGGWSMMLQLPEYLDEETVVMSLLNEKKVLVHPGYFFDSPVKPLLVLSLLTPVGAYRSGLGQIVDLIKQRVAGN